MILSHLLIFDSSMCFIYEMTKILFQIGSYRGENIVCSPNDFISLGSERDYISQPPYVKCRIMFLVHRNHVSLPVQGCQVWVCLFHAHALLSSRLEVKDSRTVQQPRSLSYHLDKALSK